LRRAGSCLIRKQWLFLYPLTLSIVSLLAFFAIYSAEGERLSWSVFFSQYHERWQYVYDLFLADSAFTSRLWVPVAAGLGFCIISALVQAPFFRAIVGHRYPLAPTDWREALRLFVFYLALNLVTTLLGAAVSLVPSGIPTSDLVALVITVVFIAIWILVAFADYVIVFESVGLVHGVRRSLRLVRNRLGTVIVIIVVLQAVFTLIHWLYGLYYQPGRHVFYLLPVSQVLVETLVHLFATILLLFLYEDLRRQSPPRAEA
jgi:hypothetical protein